VNGERPKQVMVKALVLTSRETYATGTPSAVFTVRSSGGREGLTVTAKP
jgi:hypothetical protein